MNEGLGIWLDTKYHRIRVYKATLKALGDPEYIVFGIGKKTKQIMVAASTADDREALRVGYSQYVHSKPLFLGIQKYVAPLTEGKTYSLPGKLIDGVVVCALPESGTQDAGDLEEPVIAGSGDESAQ